MKRNLDKRGVLKIIKARVGALIINEDKILLRKAEDGFYTLPGIDVSPGNVASSSLKSYLGNCQIMYKCLVENFFSSYHEFLLVYEARNYSKLKNTSPSSEWISIFDLDEVDIRPKAIKDIVAKTNCSSYFLEKED